MKKFGGISWSLFCVGILLFNPFIYGQAVFNGAYFGRVYSSLSGLVNQPETGLGPVLINISGDGTLSQSGGVLTGSTDDAGNIIWNTPNPFYFETGQIIDGVIHALGSRTDAGLTTTFRLEAKVSDSGFGALGGSLTQALRLVHPTPHVSELEAAAYGDNHYVVIGRGGMILRSGDGKTWEHVPTGLGFDLLDVAFGSGRFVAVGESGTVLYSDDAGLSWNAAVSPPVFDFRGVAYGNGRFVAAGRAAVYQSEDGINWNVVSIPDSTANQWDVVEFINSTFVIFGGRSGIGAHNEIVTSGDGVTFNAAQSYNTGSAAQGYQVAYGNGTYLITASVLAGPRVYAFNSSDGSGAVIHDPGAPIQGMIFNEARGEFIANRSNGDGIYSSTYGVAWELLAENTGPRGDEILFANGLYLIPGFNFFSSVDGLSWEKITQVLPSQLDGGVTASAEGLVFGEQGVIRGFDEVSGLAQLPTFRDGVRSLTDGFTYCVGDAGVVFRVGFTSGRLTGTPLNSNTNAHLSGIATGPFGIGSPNTQLVAVGQDGIVLQSSNGVDWVLIPSGVTTDLNALAASNDRFVTVGDTGTILTASASDISQWTAVDSGVEDDLSSVIYNQCENAFMAVGSGGVVLTSTDGMTWSLKGVGSQVDLIDAITSNQSRYFVLTSTGRVLRSDDRGSSWIDAGVELQDIPVGFSSTNNGFALQVLGRNRGYLSSNNLGEVWTFNAYPEAPESTGFQALAHGNGTWVAVGGNATATSIDGESWTFHFNPAGFNTVVYGETQFLAMGNFSSAVSYDGVHWTPGMLPVGIVVHSVAYGNGLYTAVGDSGLALTSSDGLQWTRQTTGTSDTILAIAYGDGQFIGVGRRQIRSTDGVNWEQTGVGSGNEFRGIQYADNLWVRVGRASDGDGLIQYLGDDGRWQTTLRVNERFAFNSVSKVGATWVAVGDPEENDRGASVYVSEDGLEWVAGEAHLDGRLLAVGGANGSLVALGDDRSIFRAEYPESSAPIITSQPKSQRLIPGETLALSVDAQGEGSIRFQWYLNGVPLSDTGRVSGAQSQHLIIESAQLEDVGRYTVVVSNASGSQQSLAAIVASPPVLLTQPLSKSIEAGGAVTFSVTTEGNDSYEYVWMLDGLPVMDGDNVTGQGTAQLQVQAATVSDAGVYTVEITGPNGTTTSAPAGLSLYAGGGKAGFVLDRNFPSFEIVSMARVLYVEPLADGGVLFGGEFSLGDGSGGTIDRLARLDAQGELVTSFAPNPDQQIHGILELENGNIMVSGRYLEIDGQAAGRLARLGPDGHLIDSFDLDGGFATFPHYFTDVVPTPDGRYLVGGNFNNLGEVNQVMIGMLDANGTPVSGQPFPFLNSQVEALAYQQDGRLLVGGAFRNTNPDRLVRMVTEAKFDFESDFNRGGDGPSGTVSGLGIDSLGSIYVAGSITRYNSVARNGIVKLFPDGTPDETFNANLNSPSVSDLVMVGDQPLIVGPFTGVGGQTVARIALLTPTGELDSESLQIGEGPNNRINDVSVDAKGHLLLGGNFKAFDGETHIQGVARLLRQGGAGEALDLAILHGPRSVERAEGLSASLAVVATGGSPLSFQWFKDDQPIADATGPTLLFGSIDLTDAGVYTVLVSDESGSLTSEGAEVSVVPSNPDNPPATAYSSWGAGFGIPANRLGDRDDFDADGILNFEEYAYGLNPVLPEDRSTALPKAMAIEVEGELYPAIQYRQSMGRTGFSINLEVSSSLDFETAVPTVEVGRENFSDEVEKITIRTITPVQVQPATFFKFELSRTNN